MEKFNSLIDYLAFQNRNLKPLIVIMLLVDLFILFSGKFSEGGTLTMGYMFAGFSVPVLIIGYGIISAIEELTKVASEEYDFDEDDFDEHLIKSPDIEPTKKEAI